MGSIMKYFATMMLAQFFISLVITSIVYSLPADVRNAADSFNNQSSRLSINDVATDLETGVQAQTNVPIIDTAALVYYSGNQIIDFLMNWAFGLPVVLNLIIDGIMMLFGLNVDLLAILKVALSALLGALYLFGLLEFILNMRGSGSIV